MQSPLWNDDFFPTLRKSLAVWVFAHGLLALFLLLFYFFHSISWIHFTPVLLALCNFILLLSAKLQQLLKRAYVPALVIGLIFGPMAASYLIAYLVPQDQTALKDFVAVSRGLPMMFAGIIIAAWTLPFRFIPLIVITSILVDVIAHFGLHIALDNTDVAMWQQVAVRSGSFIIIGYLVRFIRNHVDAQQLKLESHNQQLLNYSQVHEQLAIHKERSRLARELHDTLAHSITALTVQLEACKAYMDKDQTKAKELLQTSIDLARSGANETRAALKALRSDTFEQLGLKAAAIHECEQKLKGTPYQLDFDDACQHTDLAWQHTQFRTLQEALANIQKHAKASQVAICISPTRLQVQDNGIGFKPDMVDSSQHFGLLGIQERAQLQNASLHITSAPNQGCTIKLEVNDD